MADTFSCIFSSVLDVHAPLKRRRISKKSTPWITPKVKQLMRERDQLKTRATNDSTLWPRYKALRNKVTYELRNCVQQYYHAIIEENSNDPKEMWRAINKVLNKDSPSSFSAVNFQGQRLDRPNKIAEAFNEHFVTIGPKLASNIEQKPDDNPLKYLEENNENSPKFQFKQVDASCVRKAVKPRSNVPNISPNIEVGKKPKLFNVRSRVVKCTEHFIEHFDMPNCAITRVQKTERGNEESAPNFVNSVVRKMADFETATRKRKAAAAILILDILEEDQRRTWKRGKTRKWIKRRDELGHFNTIIQELRMEDMPAYKEVMRMEYAQVLEILSFIEKDITPQKIFGGNEIICPMARLTLALRFLATGETYRSLSFSFVFRSLQFHTL